MSVPLSSAGKARAFSGGGSSRASRRLAANVGRGAEPPSERTRYEQPRLEHGKPLLFGPADDRRALVLEGVKPKVVRAADVPADSVWVHDETDAATALVLAQLWAPDYPIPVGVLARKEETTYEGILIQQEQQAISDRGRGDIAKLLASGETWQIK